jgi:hypothetical protein
MVTLDDIRRYARALPEVEEATHFRLPSFKVRGKGFITVQQGDAYALLAVGQAEAAALAAADPEVYEEVWRNGGGRIFVGVRVDLAKVSGERARELVEHAWRNRAPKRLVATYDEAGR